MSSTGGVEGEERVREHQGVRETVKVFLKGRVVLIYGSEKVAVIEDGEKVTRRVNTRGKNLGG